jgi:pSer/pThr/pTyr-binding forkhead associated (FHA) protein
MDINLLLLKGDGSCKTIPVPNSVAVVGRRRDCDLRVPLDGVSRRHCRIFTHEDAIKIRDLNSRNGTIVNGQTVEETDVKPGDKVTLGPVTFVMQVNGKPEKIENAKQTVSSKDDTDIPADELFAEFSDIEPDDDETL